MLTQQAQNRPRVNRSFGIRLIIRFPAGRLLPADRPHRESVNSGPSKQPEELTFKQNASRRIAAASIKEKGNGSFPPSPFVSPYFSLYFAVLLSSAFRLYPNVPLRGFGHRLARHQRADDPAMGDAAAGCENYRDDSNRFHSRFPFLITGPAVRSRS